MREAVVVAVVRRRRQQQQVVAVLGEPLGELVAFRALHLVAAAGRSLRVGAALVGFVDDDEIPALPPDPFPDVVLLGVVDRRDDLGLALPEIQKLLLVVRGVDDLERLAEEAQQLVLPLNGQRRGDQNQAPVDGFAELQLLDEQPGHDRLAGAGVVGEQEAQPRLRQHLPIDRLDLVRQGADARQADGELPVVGIGQTDAGGLHQQAQLLGIRRRVRRVRPWLDVQQGTEIVVRQHGLVERAGRQPDAQLRARPERACVLDGHRLREVARQRDAETDQPPERGRDRRFHAGK